MRCAHLAFEREKEIPILYKSEQLGTRRVDFLVEGLIVVEIKAITLLEDIHLTQCKNYLESYQLPIGLLVNFGAARLEFKRT